MDEQRGTIEVETPRNQQSTLPRNSPQTHIHPSSSERQKCGEDKVGRFIKSMYGTQDASHIWQLDDVTLICRGVGRFRRGKHSAALFHHPNEDVEIAIHGDDCVCLSDDDGLKHIDIFSNPSTQRKDMGTLGFEGSNVKSLLLLNRVCSEFGQFKLDNTWTLNLV